MKKIVSILILLVLFTSCESGTNKKKDVPEKKTFIKEANHSKTKFMLFKSDYTPKETYRRMKEYLENTGMFYPGLVNHQIAAKNVDMELKPVYLIVFGNPKMGTLLMQENPEVGYELPLRALIYENQEGETWVMYKDMNYLKDLYFIKDANGVIEKMNTLLGGFKRAVSNPIKTTEIKDRDLN